MLLPLKTVKVNTEIRGALASSKVELSYVNASPDKVLDCFYSFKLDERSFVSDFEATVETDSN